MWPFSPSDARVSDPAENAVIVWLEPTIRIRPPFPAEENSTILVVIDLL